MEWLAILDHKIEDLQERLIALQQRDGHPPLEDLEQALAALIGSRLVLHGYLEQAQATKRAAGSPTKGR
jgi:hypothetical protein